MNVLAFDTCFSACSVAVGVGVDTARARTETLFETREKGHAERLAPMIEEALRKAGARVRDMDRFAVTNGPGTFMGVRVGVAAARGLSLAAEVPVVAASSLAVMAQEAFEEIEDRDDAAILVAADARREQVYAQLFGRDGLDALTEPRLLTVPEAAGLGAGKIVAVGSAAQAVADYAASNGRDVAVALPHLKPDAFTLLFMALRLKPESDVKPLYLREPDAKEPANPALPRV